MKKIIPILLLAGSLMLSGCGDSGDDVNVISGAPANTGPVIPNPPVPPPQPTSGIFVDSVNGNDASGNAATGSPFRTIQAAVTAAGANTDIVVRPGNYTGAVNLVNRQRLLGAGSALVTAQGTTRPVLTGPVILADGNTLDFLRIQGTTGADAINGDDQLDATVTNCEIANTTSTGVNGSGISGQNSSGNWTLSGNTISNIGGIGITIAASNSMVLVVNDNRISACAFDALDIQAAGGSVRSEVKGNVFTGNQRSFTFEALTGAGDELLMDIESNQNDDVWKFANLDATGFLGVEELTVFQTINTGVLNVLTGFGFFPVTNLQDGQAGF